MAELQSPPQLTSALLNLMSTVFRSRVISKVPSFIILQVLCRPLNIAASHAGRIKQGLNYITTAVEGLAVLTDLCSHMVICAFSSHTWPTLHTINQRHRVVRVLRTISTNKQPLIKEVIQTLSSSEETNQSRILECLHWSVTLSADPSNVPTIITALQHRISSLFMSTILIASTHVAF